LLYPQLTADTEKIVVVVSIPSESGILDGEQLSSISLKESNTVYKTNSLFNFIIWSHDMALHTK
jgi:hypothetical protein